MKDGVNKKVDKKIIFIIKLRGVVEGLYLQIQKMLGSKNYNKYIGGLINVKL